LGFKYFVKTQRRSAWQACLRVEEFGEVYLQFYSDCSIAGPSVVYL
jgi:hypothetical protein